MFKKLASVVNYAVGWGKQDDSSDEEGSLEADTLFDQMIQDIYKYEESEEKISSEPDLAAPILAPVLKTQHRIGKITRLYQNDGVIDDKYFFDRRDAPNMGLDVGKSVTYHAFRNSEQQEWRVTKIIAVHEESWNDSEPNELPTPEAQPEEEDVVVQEGSANKRTIVGRVQLREGREVIVRDCMQRIGGGTVPRDTRFNLDDVSSEFTPLEGDIVNMDCIVEVSEETLDGSGDVIQVLSLKPSRARMAEGTVTKWIRQHRWGDVNKEVRIDRDACESGYIPRTNDEVKMEIIECESREYRWRAISVHPLAYRQREEYPKASKVIHHVIDPDLLKNKGNINVQENTDFKALPAVGDYKIEVSVSNDGEASKWITNHYVESEPSNLRLISPKAKKIKIEPTETVIFSFDYNKTMCGYNSEVFVIESGDIQIGRLIKWEVFNPDIPGPTATPVPDDKFYVKTRSESAQKYMQVQESRASWVPGVRTSRGPFFQKFRFPPYEIPIPIKEAMTAGSDGLLVSKKDSAKTLKNHYPELDQPLSSLNYLRRFHQLLYISEMDGQIDMCRYSMERVSFVRRGQASEYLALEVPGLAEGRPSLLVNDAVVVKSSWGSRGAHLQGYIHKICSNEVWLKFDIHFHNTYNSEDYDVFFVQSRTCFKRCHAALDHCQSNQALLWLFPKGVRSKPPQVAVDEDVGFGRGVEDIENSFQKDNGLSERSVNLSPRKEKEIAEAYCNRRKKLNWVNKRLNHRQKEAVRNILRGEARPLPYIIFGPPGTGKTMTLVEIILQIYMLMDDSRILIATPSNSSANLIAERLLDSNLLQPGDMVRLVATHLITDGKLPPSLVPYCATIDPNSAAVDSSEPDSNGFRNLNSRLIMRQRITIGTCVALGQIMTLGFPRGHYTHVVVDEAGQATEPEILLPLGFMAHESGQAILAGDPNQLGPVVQSSLAGDLGLSKSLLARLLPRFPYQRDPTGFPESGGYDPRLVTRLTVNYRSLPDILELPSSLFYDGDLEPWVSEEGSYEAKLLARATTNLNLPHSAVVFRGIKGNTCRDNDSPSYWNPHECVEVVQYITQLLAADIKREDIGIITPYQKQAMKLRYLLERLESRDATSGVIKIGSVEEFQGQERMVIILSTVRSIGGGHIETIGRNTARTLLGFVNNPERLNVAISRARALLIICGDAEVLCIDHYWRSVVKYCVERKSYIGAAISKHLLDK